MAQLITYLNWSLFVCVVHSSRASPGLCIQCLITGSSSCRDSSLATRVASGRQTHVPGSAWPCVASAVATLWSSRRYSSYGLIYVTKLDDATGLHGDNGSQIRNCVIDKGNKSHVDLLVAGRSAAGSPIRLCACAYKRITITGMCTVCDLQVSPNNRPQLCTYLNSLKYTSQNPSHIWSLLAI